MTPTGGEGIDDDAGVLRWRDAVRDLEHRVAGNGEDQRELREVLKGVEESSDRIKKQIADDRIALERRFGEADVKLERAIGDLRTVITSGFAEMRGERAAEQRLASDHKAANRWTWQLVVFALLSAAGLVLGIYNAVRK